MPTDRGPNRVIVVLGYDEIGEDGAHRISAICRAGVRRAEALAAESSPLAVILTGWSSNGGPSEAEQMRDAWQGRWDVPLLVEPHAVNTAENAVRSLGLISGIAQAEEVVVVCSVRHALRVHFFFDGLYERHGYRVAYRYVVRPAPSPALWAHEASSITRMVRDRRAALGLLGRDAAGSRPDARLRQRHAVRR
jgi:uncharacterized SAM-binding protein YcdF (DUF218 family)